MLTYWPILPQEPFVVSLRAHEIPEMEGGGTLSCQCAPVTTERPGIAVHVALPTDILHIHAARPPISSEISCGRDTIEGRLLLHFVQKLRQPEVGCNSENLSTPQAENSAMTPMHLVCR
jgi:hypothetical protein